MAVPEELLKISVEEYDVIFTQPAAPPEDE